MEFVEVYLSGDDPVVGKTVSDISAALPTECVLVSIARDSRVIVPHGDTIFQAGDQVTAFTRQADAQKLFQCLHGNQALVDSLSSGNGQKLEESE